MVFTENEPEKANLPPWIHKIDKICDKFVIHLPNGIEKRLGWKNLSLCPTIMLEIVGLGTQTTLFSNLLTPDVFGRHLVSRSQINSSFLQFLHIRFVKCGIY